MTRKQLEKLISEYNSLKSLDHKLCYGKIHGDEPRKFWYVIPFGGYARKIGNTLSEAGETISHSLDRMRRPLR